MEFLYYFLYGAGFFGAILLALLVCGALCMLLERYNWLNFLFWSLVLMGMCVACGAMLVAG